MKISALSPWYGSNRMLAKNVGDLLAGCEWVGVPCAGGMSELAHVKARTVVVGDVHRHVINLAMVVADAGMNPELVAALDATIFHPDVLAAAQAECRHREADPVYVIGLAPPRPGCPSLNRSARIEWARDYFVCAWMARNGTAGTDGEFRAGLSLRWEAGGGDSAVRFRNATEALKDWHRVMRRCTFTCEDVFDFLAKVKDRAGHGVYVDAPWPTDGDKYKHKFGEAQQRRLADVLAGFTTARVVVRYGDCPLVRELYPADLWEWVELTGRTAANKAKAEVLIVQRAGEGLA